MGQKKSDFIQQATVSDDATFDFVFQGQNLKINKADLVALFGAIGTLEQVGKVVSTPILRKNGTTNQIRNLEDGQGFKASVSPDDGATLEHNFIEGSSGFPIFVDNPDLTTLFRNLVSGTGINISVSGDALRFDATGIITASTTVIVNDMADFPSAVAGVRTLDADTEYLVSPKLTTADRLILQNNTVLNGSNSRVSGLTYTGTGTFITAVDATCEYSRLTTIIPNGTFIDISSTTGSHQFLMSSVNASEVKTLGTFSGLQLFQILQCSFDDITTNGFAPTGNNLVILIERVIATTNAGTFLDLGTSTSSAIILTTFLAQTASGATFLSGLTASGNINAGGLASIFSGRFSGAGTILNNISTDDALWQFLLNDDIPDTRPDGLLSMQANATPTVITTQSVPVLIAGTWTVKDTSQMTGTTAGRLTYNGGKDAKLPITASVTVEPVSGASQIMSACVAVDGVIDVDSIRTASATPGNPSSITIPWQDTFSTATFVEIFVANESTATNVLVSSAIHRVN